MEHITEERFSDSEVKIIKKEILRSYAIGLLIGVMISFLLLLLMFTKKNHSSPNLSLILAIISFSVFITSLTLRNLHSDLRKKIKHLTHFKIIEKLSYLDDEPGLSVAGLKYFLVSKEKRFAVNQQLFDEANVNDTLIEHLAPKSKYLLELELSKNP